MPCNGISSRDITVTFQDNLLVAQTIGKIRGWTRGGASANLFDESTFDSTASEFCPGLKNEGQITVTVLTDYDDAGQSAMRDAFAQGEKREMVVTMPSGTITTFTFDACVDSFEDDASDINGENIGTFTLQVSGSITES